MTQYAEPLEQHIAYVPACVGLECAICDARICSGDVYYVDPDGMPVCSDCK